MPSTCQNFWTSKFYSKLVFCPRLATFATTSSLWTSCQMSGAWKADLIQKMIQNWWNWMEWNMSRHKQSQAFWSMWISMGHGPCGFQIHVFQSGGGAQNVHHVSLGQQKAPQLRPFELLFWGCWAPAWSPGFRMPTKRANWWSPRATTVRTGVKQLRFKCTSERDEISYYNSLHINTYYITYHSILKVPQKKGNIMRFLIYFNMFF